MCQWKLDRTVKDPSADTFCYRSYLKSLNQPNVQLVQQRISRINEHSILTADGKEHPVDVIVIATGFDLVSATPKGGQR